MIVREQYARATEASSVGDDFADGQVNRALSTSAIAAKVKAARTFIDVGNPQHFAGGRGKPGKTGRKEVPRGIVAGEDSGGFGTLNFHNLLQNGLIGSVERPLSHAQCPR